MKTFSFQVLTVMSFLSVRILSAAILFKYSEEVLKEGFCGIVTEESDKKVVTFFKCPSGYKCKYGTLECEKKPQRNYAGDKCETSDDCYSDLPCEDGVCKGKEDGESCDYHYQCSKYSYCDEEEYACKKLKEEREECYDSTECGFFSLCLESLTGTQCIRPFSLKLGEKAATSGQCETGFLRGVCSEAKSLKDGEDCQTSGDCPFEITVPGKEPVTEEGQCSYSYSGRKLCNWGTNSTSLNKIHSIIQKEIAKFEKNPTHIATEKYSYFADGNIDLIIDGLFSGAFSEIDENIFDVLLD